MSEVNYMVEQLEALVNIPSPSGYTKKKANFLIEYLTHYSLESADLMF